MTVAPACNLVNKVAPGVPRLVINAERVGEELGLDFAPGGRDVLLRTECDLGFMELARRLGWLQELAAHRDQMCSSSVAVLDAAIRMQAA